MVFLTPHSSGLSGKQHPSAAPLTLEFHPQHLGSEFNSVPDPCHLGTDPDPWIRKFDLRILLFSSMTAKMPIKKKVFSNFLLITICRHFHTILQR